MYTGRARIPQTDDGSGISAFIGCARPPTTEEKPILDTLPTQPPTNLQQAGPFWDVLERSRIPIALIDEDRRYVYVNQAVIELYQYPRAEVIGNLAGRTIQGDPSDGDADWEQLRSTNEVYGERVILDAKGTKMRVSYAAHATTLGDRWLALVVTLSASSEPDGPQLIGTADVESAARGLELTQRELEIVRLVALGADTRHIAAELSLSPETVRSHVRNAMIKTGAHTRAQLVAVVLTNGSASG
jgi:DNA-binding CsgD family transcriptional regulator